MIAPSGPYRLRASAEFGFGQRHAQHFDGVMRMAFALDGTFAPVAVAVRQAVDDSMVEVEVIGSADTERAVAQTARVLSLDHDAAGYAHVGGARSDRRPAHGAPARTSTAAVPLAVRGGRVVGLVGTPTSAADGGGA